MAQIVVRTGRPSMPKAAPVGASVRMPAFPVVVKSGFKSPGGGTLQGPPSPPTVPVEVVDVVSLVVDVAPPLPLEPGPAAPVSSPPPPQPELPLAQATTVRRAGTMTPRTVFDD